MKKKIRQIIAGCLIGTMVISGVLPGSVAAAEPAVSEEPGEITGFGEFDINEHALNLLIEDKPSLEELLDLMPETLEVYLDGGSETESIAVDWYCVGEDYEESDSFYFQFSPMWDEEKYRLMDEIDLLTEAPYIAVFFRTEADSVSAYSVTNNSNEATIFHYLTEVLGYNVAAACGAMANIYCESSFIPINLQNKYETLLGFTDASYTLAVDSGTYTNFVYDSAGYGLCQWTFYTRKQNLLNYAKQLGTSIGDITMQLRFLNQELSAGSTAGYMKSAPNTAEGAYNVGYYFCDVYERPAQTEHEVSVYRGNLAKNTYWAEYAGTKDYRIQISGQNLPGTMTAGSSFSPSGTISSGVNLTNVTAGVYDYQGKMVTGKSVVPNAKSYSLSSMASQISFSTLPPGVYTYRVTAKNPGESKTLVDQIFIVLATSRTVSDGRYMLIPMVNRSLVADASGGNLLLKNNTNAESQYFEVTYAGDGYYTLKNCSSEAYMDVSAGTAAVNHTNVQLYKETGGSAQNWQILPMGEGYCLIPQCATSYCLNVSGGGKTSGTNLELYRANLNKAQNFKLITGKIGEVFRDVYEEEWYIEYVRYVFENGLMSGNDGKFTPNGAITRGMVVQTLYRLAGAPEVTDYKACRELKDVYQDWYTDAVCWAYNTGVTTGYTDTRTFKVDVPVTREQIAAFFYRYSQNAGYDTTERGDLSKMLNADAVSDYAKEAVSWTVGEGLISGIESKDASGLPVLDLAPQGNATRAQVAAILSRFCEKNGL